MVSAFSRWRRFDESRQKLAKVSELFAVLSYVPMLQLCSIIRQRKCYFRYSSNCIDIFLLRSKNLHTIFAATTGNDNVCQWIIRERIRDCFKELSLVL